ncbi:MAG: DUF2333 family protein [Gammaproteobacteria bacterium]|nr:DUF2333 family protein [Gammaproteobacteria bacterium]MBT8151002.1 DUF2333 family protein [Gammaproteobacteria bacterium]NND38292.1 DUF2333 family protein [Pseudomonadales bacterium]NNM11480.1 DUF2333 family protein [Pseudomonadales bacterium]RZV57088.1 MAG: DUF2333 family protein [Pseudomonadales bacterium]
MDSRDRVDMIKADVSYWWADSIILKVLLYVLAAYLLVAVVLAVYWSNEPEQFDVVQAAAARSAADNRAVVPGTVTTATLMQLAETLLEKPGGFLSNDIAPPGVLLDNMPNWEFGVLVQVRDLARSMREGFSRSQSQSTEDGDLSLAEPRFHFDNNSWIFPRSEDEYRDGKEFVGRYLKRLSDPGQGASQFFTRADNLVVWLATVESRLGSLSQRLSASVGQKRLNTDLAGEPDAERSTATPDELLIKTSWYEIDDVLYEARGTSWALVHCLKAVEVDFADVLKKKNALVSLRQIIRELETTQQTIWSPVVLNGSGFGFFANHSLVMASYISRANAGIIDLRELLTRG